MARAVVSVLAQRVRQARALRVPAVPVRPVLVRATTPSRPVVPPGWRVRRRPVRAAPRVPAARVAPVLPVALRVRRAPAAARVLLVRRVRAAVVRARAACLVR
ncbi:hypothetical protein, partial [Streptomyces sp. SID12501]|uniref:hypothetical protein n=1 Tax=Streptomyces sp. SID12501 TaxID=2706042 RepID=UPI0023B2326F